MSAWNAGKTIRNYYKVYLGKQRRSKWVPTCKNRNNFTRKKKKGSPEFAFSYTTNDFVIYHITSSKSLKWLLWQLLSTLENPQNDGTALYETLNSTTEEWRGSRMKLSTGCFMTTDESHYYTFYDSYWSLTVGARLSDGQHMLKARRWCTVHVTNRILLSVESGWKGDDGSTPSFHYMLRLLSPRLLRPSNGGLEQTTMIRLSFSTGTKPK